MHPCDEVAGAVLGCIRQWYQQVEEDGPATHADSALETSTGVLCPGLGTPGQEGQGHVGVSPAKGYWDI